MQTDEDLLRASFEMKTSENDNFPLMNKVEKPIGKTPKESPTDLFMNAWKTERVPLRDDEASVDRAQEIYPQTWRNFVIPQISIEKIRFGFGPKDDFVCHPRFKILFLTSDQGEPAEGFLWKAFRR